MHIQARDLKQALSFDLAAVFQSLGGQDQIAEAAGPLSARVTREFTGRVIRIDVTLKWLSEWTR